MILNAPQVIWFGLTLLGLGLSLGKHGQPKTGEWNFFVDLFVSILAFGLLYWGGFFG